MKFTVLAVMLFTSAAQASCLLYEGQWSWRVIGRVEGGRGGDKLLEGAYSTRQIGDIRDNLIYEHHSASSVLGRIDGDLVYEGRYSTRVWAHFESGCK